MAAWVGENKGFIDNEATAKKLFDQSIIILTQYSSVQVRYIIFDKATIDSSLSVFKWPHKYFIVFYTCSTKSNEACIPTLKPSASVRLATLMCVDKCMYLYGSCLVNAALTPYKRMASFSFVALADRY